MGSSTNHLGSVRPGIAGGSCNCRFVANLRLRDRADQSKPHSGGPVISSILRGPEHFLSACSRLGYGLPLEIASVSNFSG